MAVETELDSEVWVRTLGMDARSLPAIWDADFLLRPQKNVAGQDAWVLCEVNASCVSPFPDEAAQAIARNRV
jgi:hypothetical protein